MDGGFDGAAGKPVVGDGDVLSGGGREHFDGAEAKEVTGAQFLSRFAEILDEPKDGVEGMAENGLPVAFAEVGARIVADSDPHFRQGPEEFYRSLEREPFAQDAEASADIRGGKGDDVDRRVGGHEAIRQLDE